MHTYLIYLNLNKNKIIINIDISYILIALYGHLEVRFKVKTHIPLLNIEVINCIDQLSVLFFQVNIQI